MRTGSGSRYLRQKAWKRCSSGERPSVGAFSPASRRADGLQGAAPVAALADPLDRPYSQQLEPIRFLPSLLEPLEALDFREVEQRARDRRDRNLAAFAPVLGVQSASMDPEPLPAFDSLTSRRSSDFNHRAPLPRQSPERSGAAMAQQRSIAVSQNPSPPIALLADLRVTNRVDLGVKRGQPPNVKPQLYRLLSKPDRE